MTHRLALIIAAGGRSTRIGAKLRKPLIPVGGEPILCHTLRRFQGLDGLHQVTIVVHPDDVQRVTSTYWPRLRQLGATHLAAGGARRQDSVAAGLAMLRSDVEIVLIHDAVRPFVPREAIEASVQAAAEHGAAVVGMPVADTLKRVRAETAVETVPRGDLWGAQTPQVFRLDLIRRAFDAAARDGFECTDDAQLVERLGIPVRLVAGSPENFKITTAKHLRMAEAMLASGA